MIRRNLGDNRKSKNSSRRSGATMVEFAIVIMLFLMLMFGTLEMAVAIFRYHLVSQGARQAARLTIVHGKLAAPEMNVWGPAEYNAGDLSAATDEVATSVKPYLAGLPMDGTSLKIEWLDGGTSVGQRIRTTVTTSYSPFITFMFSSGWSLTAQSTMQIAH